MKFPSLPGILLIILGLFLMNVGIHGAGLLPIQNRTAFLPAEPIEGVE